MRTVLVADDNVFLVEALALRIEMYMDEGKVLTAHNGKEAVQQLDAWPVDFILTDLNMPVLDGFGVILHRNQRYSQTPLIVMTASLTPGLKRTLGALNITECIEKPFDFDRVARRIVRSLNIDPNAYAARANAAYWKMAGRAA